MRYLRFVLDNRRFLGFGFALAALSSFGQTFFIALFGAEIRDAFALSHGGFGTVYSVATLASAGCLVWIGQRTDDTDLRAWSAFVLTGLACACALMAWAPGAIALGVAIFGLRLFGQGLSSHTSTVSMARYFDATRGRAVSVAALGHPAGEGLLPLPMVAVAAAIGWRETWIGCGAAIAVIGIPATLWLLRGHAERHRRWVARAGAGSADAAPSRTRGEVLRDPVFFALLPAALTPSYVVTGLFFHQAHVAASKGWPLTVLAASFAAYAAASVATSLAAGHLVDRHGATRVLPYAMGPLALGLVALALGETPLVATAYLLLAGASQGIQFTVQGALWVEIYGSRHIGAIRALITALSVFASALAPATMGWLLDAGTGVTAIALGSVAWIAIALGIALAGLALRDRRRAR